MKKNEVVIGDGRLTENDLAPMPSMESRVFDLARALRETKSREERLQQALDETDADQLLTLKLMVSTYYEGMDHRTREGATNILVWNERIQNALNSKR